MLDDLELVEESELPPLTDSKWTDIARDMGEEFDVFSKARHILTDEIWPACDRAWHCIRDDFSTAIPTMKFVDNGMLGESDIRDALKGFRTQLISTLLPGDESWLRPASSNEEDNEDVLTRIQEHQIYLHEQVARTRDTMEVAIDQLLIRGTTAVGVRWDRMRAIHSAPRELAATMSDLALQMDAREANGKPVKSKKIKYWTPVRNQPVVFPIDMYRLYLDPKAELGLHSDIATIYVMFKTVNDLKSAKNEETGEHLYDQDVLKDISEWTYSDYYKDNAKACESSKLMGIDPSLENEEKFLPVYMFHKLVRETDDGDVWVDKFFYLTRSSGAMDWRVIRVQDNPSNRGHKPFYIALCDRWMNTPYGTGLAEKSLSALKAKNLTEALGLNGKVLSIFPPFSYIGNVAKDDRKPIIRPAGAQEIVNRANVGLNWIATMPIVNPNAAVMSMQDGRYYGQKIIAQTGASTVGAVTDPTKSLSTSPTATEVRQTTTEGYTSVNALADRLGTGLLQPTAQCVYDYSRQYTTKEDIYITTSATGQVTTGKVTPAELDRDRTIIIVGRRGLANKAHILDNLLKALEILSNPNAAQVVQNLPLMLQDIIFKLLGQLGIPLKPDYKTPPEMIAARTPEAQQAALQGALQNPEMRQQLADELMNSPEGQEFIGELMQQAHDHGAKNATEQAQMEHRMDAAVKGPQVSAMAAQAAKAKE